MPDKDTETPPTSQLFSVGDLPITRLTRAWIDAQRHVAALYTPTPSHIAPSQLSPQAAALPLDLRAKPARKPRERIAGHLLTPNEAAAYLGNSVKTLRKLSIPFIIVGCGRVKARRMYAHADLDCFIEAQRQKAKPCPSISAKTRRSTTTTSKCEVVAFTALQGARASAKPKR